MPNHWETSARPLFVKTVFVNGNRHAILFEEDPLLRCGNSPYKKISRPNSSLSSTSDLSISYSESQDSSFEGKSFKLRSDGQKQPKDLPSKLQNCLVKLKLASGSLENQNKSTQEKCFCNSKDLNRSQSKEKGNSKQKRHKWNHEKISKRKQHEQFYDEPTENKSGGRKTSRENNCYVYSLENCEGKKKYCFVKISSQPPKFILNCCCEKSSNETYNCNPISNKNLVISATVHNLVMPSEENLLHKTLDYIFPFQNAELYFNNHLTKSYYNSLSDRVFRWLDLARRRKDLKEKSNSINEGELSLNDSTERIFSGKTFVDKTENAECSSKSETNILITKRVEKLLQSAPQGEAEGEADGEPQIETLLFTDKINFHDSLVEKHSSKISLDKCAMVPQTGKGHNNENFSGTSIPIKNIFSGVNLTGSPLKVQDLRLNYAMNETSNFRDQSKKKIKEFRNSSTHQNKHKDTYGIEERKEFTTMPMKHWGKKVNHRISFLDKFDSNSKQLRCRDDRNFDEYSDKIKNSILTEEFTERNQKSINNLKITQTEPAFVQNLLSPQQPDKMSYLQEEKIVWASEKNTGRPQLHIFMPSILRRYQSDDTMSECESFLNS